MDLEDSEFLGSFYRALKDGPLGPADPLYVPLYENSALVRSDPIQVLFRGIDWAESESMQAFTGLRGTGKSTELARLQRKLEAAGCAVLRTDMVDYLNLSTPLDVTDFLLAVAGSFSDALEADALLGKDPNREGYWERFVHFVKDTKIELGDIGLKGGGAGVEAEIKLNLKRDDSFKKKLRERMEGHLGRLVEDVHAFVADSVAALRKHRGDPDLKVVFLLDSLEQLRGSIASARDIHTSAEGVFVGHSDKLRLPYVHTVYTVPPWLKIQAPGLGAEFDSVTSIPAVKVRTSQGEEFQPALDTLERLVGQRGDWKRLLGREAQLKKLCLASGGYLRDLFRLLRSCLMAADQRGYLPLEDEDVTWALNELQNQYRPLSTTDARWLASVATSHRAELPDLGDLGDLARLFGNSLILAYRNDVEWYDVHPIVKARVLEIAATAAARTASERDDGTDSKG